MNAIERDIDEIVEAEGGLVFTDRAIDRGGPTFAGITYKTFTAWRLARYGTTPTVEDLRNIKEREVRQIYRDWYIVEPGFGDIEDDLVRLNLIDAGVLHGTGWAARRMQEVVGVKVDGDIGPISKAAINRQAEYPALNLRFVRRRIEKVIRIARADVSQLGNLSGWTNRAMRFLLMEAELLDATN